MKNKMIVLLIGFSLLAMSGAVYANEKEVIELTSLSVDANGGTLCFAANEEYESTFSVYSVEPGQTIKEVMEVDYNNPLICAEKEGAEFAGWTVYTCDVIEWLDELVEGDGIVCVPFGEDMYTVLTDSEICAELVTLEEMGEIVCEDTNYYAVAIWK